MAVGSIFNAHSNFVDADKYFHFYPSPRFRLTSISSQQLWPGMTKVRTFSFYAFIHPYVDFEIKSAKGKAAHPTEKPFLKQCHLNNSNVKDSNSSQFVVRRIRWMRYLMIVFFYGNKQTTQNI